MWTYTKTTWAHGDPFDIIDDYNRIKDNIEELHVLAVPRFGDFTINVIPDQDHAAFYFMGLLNGIEENIDALADNTYWFATFRELIYSGRV